jgi:predicted O-methyltransferase YrrM
MEHNLTIHRNKNYKSTLAIKKACSNPGIFYQKCKTFLEEFYVERVRKQSSLKTVPLADLIPESVDVRLSNFHNRRDGNVTTYETLAISSLIQHHKPTTLLELGTFDGNTTLQMALNAPENAVIHTLDLPSEPMRTKEPISKADLIYVLDEQKNRRKYVGSPVEHKIRQHFGDSTNFDFSEFTKKGLVDFIFIDAGHTYECVKSDTQNALQILAPNGVIIWHDFHPFWNGVYRFLNEFSQTLPLVHIEGTNLAYHHRTM